MYFVHIKLPNISYVPVKEACFCPLLVSVSNCKLTPHPCVAVAAAILHSDQQRAEILPLPFEGGFLQTCHCVQWPRGGGKDLRVCNVCTDWLLVSVLAKQHGQRGNRSCLC